jgi:hypothetical protein
VPRARVLRLTTVRSHDQYNTTICGLNDRYRGVFGGRKVAFVMKRICRHAASRPKHWSKSNRLPTHRKRLPRRAA